jgi:hypothetical protein
MNTLNRAMSDHWLLGVAIYLDDGPNNLRQFPLFNGYPIQSPASIMSFKSSDNLLFRSDTLVSIIIRLLHSCLSSTTVPVPPELDKDDWRAWRTSDRNSPRLVQ